MQLKFQRDPPPSTSRRLLPLLAMVCLMIYFACRGRNDDDAKAKANVNDVQSSLRTTITLSSTVSKGEMVPIYELPPSLFPKEPAHLTPVDPSTLISKGSHPIDVAHRNGYLHTGHILYVMDSSGKILFLQRSVNVVTCPSIWSLLGGVRP